MDSEDFTEDDACAYTRKMWVKLGHKLADDAALKADPMDALKYAMAADACYWQATGVMDSMGVKDILTQEPKA